MPYMPALDGIRAIAIMLVLLFHANVPVFPGGNLGVDVFFVLSGFLITRLLLLEWYASGRLDTRRFYWRRIWRLMPPLLVLLALYAIAAPLIWPDYPFHLRDGLMTLLYLGNLGAAFGYTPSQLLHGWSLAVEEQFYLLWPLLLLGAFRLRLPLWQSLLLIYVLMNLWRCWALFGLGIPTGVAYFRPDIHSSGLVLGGVVAASIGRGDKRHVPRWLFWPCCLMGALAVLWPRSDVAHLAFFVPVTELCVAGVLLWLLAYPDDAGGRWLAGTPLVMVGKLSYGLYLYHFPLMKALQLGAWGWPMALLFGSAGALLLATLSYHFVEQPAKRYRLGRYA